jgi:hypothetical protein
MSKKGQLMRGKQIQSERTSNLSVNQRYCDLVLHIENIVIRIEGMTIQFGVIGN